MNNRDWAVDPPPDPTTMGNAVARHAALSSCVSARRLTNKSIHVAFPVLLSTYRI